MHTLTAILMPVARRPLAIALAAAGALALVSCVDRLPDQDLRILQTPPAAKLSVDLLWKEYRDNAKQADRTYKGQAVLITGTVKVKAADAPAAAVPAKPRLEFPQDGTNGVVAYLLDEQAAEIVALAAATPRITIKCFVQGIEAGSPDVVLKSCIKP